MKLIKKGTTETKANRKTIFILLVITLSGILLRLWGAGHGLSDELLCHPDEPPFAYNVEGFVKSFPAMPLWPFSPLWTYLHSLVVFIYSLLEGLLKYLFGMRHSGIIIFPGIYDIILIGRVMCGIIGGMTIPIVYLSGKRLFNEKIGLIGAGIMAVVFLHMSQSHYSYVDVPQTFFLILSFYFMVKVSSGGGKWDSFLSGVLLALSIAIKINTAPAFLVLIVAHYLRERATVHGSTTHWSTTRSRIKGLIRSKYLYISIAGFIIGYALCAPWFILKPDLILKTVNSILNLLYKPESPTAFNVGVGVTHTSNIFYEDIGIHFILLLFLGLTIAAIKREKNVILILAFPLIYLPFFLSAAWQDQRELIPVLPFAVIFMAYGLYSIANMIPFKRKGFTMVIVSLFFILPSLWTCLKTDYFLWHRDTRVFAAEWIKENLPWDARIGMEGYNMYNVPIYRERYQIDGKFSKLSLEEVKEKIDFIVISSILYNNLDPKKKKLYDSLKETSQLIKVFKTSASYFFNPRIEIYKLSRQGEASASIISKTYSEKDSYYLSFEEGVYGKEPLSFWIWPGSNIKRVLISEKKSDAIGIFLYNGQEKTTLKVKTGFKGRRIELKPYERKAIVFEPSRSFPFTEYIYKISMDCGITGGTFVNILTDPKKIADALIEIGEWKEAIPILSKNNLLDKEGWSLLGIAYSMGGRHKDALEAFKSGWIPSIGEILDSKEWINAFERFTNIDSAFLVESLTVNYRLDQFPQQTGRKTHWIAQFDPEIDRPGFLLYGPYKRLPKGHFKAIFKVRVVDSVEGPAARIDVFNSESDVLDEMIIKDTKGKVKEFTLNFYNEEPDRRLEFRVEALGGRELWAEEIKVLPDVHNYYNGFFSMVHHYWGLSAGESDLKEEAIEHFRIAGALGYKDTEGLYQMAKVYEKIGMKEEAMNTYRKVITEIPNHLDSLIALKRVQSPTSQKDLEIEERINCLVPGNKTSQNFSDLIEFVGYSVGKEKVHKGEEFNISYFWRAIKKLRANYSIFVHFRINRNTVFQNDHSPSLEMRKWKKGGIVREDFKLMVPHDAPDGRYDIIIGMWDPVGLKERLKLKGQSIDEIKIGTIEVLAK